MALEPYFKTAANALRSAIMERRHEIDLIKKQQNDKETEVRRQIDDLRQDKSQKESQSAKTDMNDGMRLELQRQAQQDLTHITELEKSIGNEHDAMQKQVAEIERDIIDLEQKVRELEARA